MAGTFVRYAAQGVHHYLAESLRICSVYLGIAVLVTVSTGLIVPGLRDQALQVHKALLMALAPPSATEPDVAPLAATTPPAVALAVPTPGSKEASLLAPPQAHNGPLPAAAVERSLRTASRAQVEALRNYIARKYKVAYDVTGVLVNTAYKVGEDLKVDPLLLLAVIAIESRYNPFAESSVGAQGLMQVMTNVHQSKFDAFGKGGALDPVTNIRVGASILKECIARRGSVSAGLSCYVGATNANDGGYSDRVQAERRRLAVASGLPLARD
jgi:hypothetical protein